MLDLSNSSVVFCGIVRDAAEGLKRNIPVVEKVAAAFGDWKVVVYENDSRDGTKALLREWHERYPENVFAIMEDTDPARTIPRQGEVASEVNPFFSRRRIEKMAALRNKYLSYIAAQGWTPDYLAVVDLDVARIWADGFLDSFGLMDEWNVVTANGYSLSPNLRRRYHDSYALCEYGGEASPQTEDIIKKSSSSYARMGSDPVRVYSAFGGASIYRFPEIAGLSYCAPSNNDPRVEVRCEHFGLIRQIYARQGDIRVCINPSFRIHYQRLSLRIVLGSLKRRLSLFYQKLIIKIW